MPAATKEEELLTPDQERGDRFRPRLHLTPPANWMNDPNGLVSAANGYHAFYQHNPSSLTWGNIVWGHARSDDLIHWTHHRIAISPSDAMAFSGSAITCAGPRLGIAAPEVIIAAYTAHDPESGLEEQRIAISVDGGDSWQHSDAGPVGARRQHHFRDPRLFWHEPSKAWVMAVALALEHRVLFYNSFDLINWSECGSFHAAEDDGVEWECPELIPLDDPCCDGESLWLLKVDISRGAVAGGSGGKYFLGTFDGASFVAKSILSRSVSRDGLSAWLDYGADFYAAQVVSGAIDCGGPVWMAWASNWRYARHTPSDGWRGCLSLPRTLSLRRFVDGYALCQQPISRLQHSRGQPTHVRAMTIDDTAAPSFGEFEADSTFELVCRFSGWSAAAFGITVAKGENCETSIGVKPHDQCVFVDRRQSGLVDFHEDFAAVHTAPLTTEHYVELRIVFDRSIIEVFVNQGEIVLTTLVFPEAQARAIEWFAHGGKVELQSATYWPLESRRVQ